MKDDLNNLGLSCAKLSYNWEFFKEYFADFQLFKSSSIQVVCFGRCLPPLKKLFAAAYLRDAAAYLGAAAVYMMDKTRTRLNSAQLKAETGAEFGNIWKYAKLICLAKQAKLAPACCLLFLHSYHTMTSSGVAQLSKIIRFLLHLFITDRIQVRLSVILFILDGI